MQINNQVKLERAINLLSKKRLDPKSLSKKEQNLIIEHLRYEMVWSQSRIAKLLNLVTDTVRSRIRKIDESYRNTLISRGFDSWTIIADLKRKKEIVQQKAGKQGNWNLVWKTEIDFISLLSKLNLLEEPKTNYPCNENSEHTKVNVKELMKILDQSDSERQESIT